MLELNKLHNFLFLFVSLGLFAIIGLSIFSAHFDWKVRYSYSGTIPYATGWEVVTRKSSSSQVIRVETIYQWSYGIGWGGVVWTFFGLLVAIIHKFLLSRSEESPILMTGVHLDDS